MSHPQPDPTTQPAFPAGLQPLGALPGVSGDGMLSGDAVGYCADGVCHLPGAPEKTD